MPRREYRTSFTCAEPACRDTQFYAVSTRAEESALYKRQHEHPYRCSRHANPEQNLRPGNEQTTYIVVATRVPASPLRGFPDEPRWLDGLFWREEGSERAGSGFTFGPGFNAHASDFPEGTRLIVTAQIEIPAPVEISPAGTLPARSDTMREISPVGRPVSQIKEPKVDYSEQEEVPGGRDARTAHLRRAGRSSWGTADAEDHGTVRGG